MDPIKEATERLAAIKAELSAIRDAVKLGKRTMNDDERKRWDELSAESAALKDRIATLEADAKRFDAVDGIDQELARPRGRRTQHDDPGDDGAGNRLQPVDKPAFRTLGEQLQAIAHAGRIGDHPGSRDGRLHWETLTPATGSAQATVPSDGGYLIQKDFATELLSRMNDFGEIKNRVRTIPISANSDGLKIHAVNETSRATGSRWGGVQVYWGAENDAATAKKPSFRLMELELHDLIGLAYVSNRLLQDASAVEAVFMQAFSEEMSFMCEDALVNGDGAGKPLGVVNSGAMVSVAKETGQAATTLVYENLVKMWSRLWARSRANAVWLINQDIEPQLHSMSLAIGTGGVPVYMPAGGLSEKPHGSLFGRPVLPVEYCATLGTTGDIMLVDFSQMIAIEKGGMAADSSIHVRFTTNENTFRFVYRYDAQPVWNSALTPFKGSATKSPFVKLDTRS